MDDFVPKKKAPKKLKETGRGGVEQTGRKAVHKAGGWSLKWTSPGFSGVPDQIELYGVERMISKAHEFNIFMTREEAVVILSAGIEFCEYKAPGQKPTANQLTVHGLLRARGFTVNVIDYLRK